jgi:hypothetical protein
VSDKPLVPVVPGGLLRALAKKAAEENALKTLSVPCAYLVSYDLNAAQDGFNYLPLMLELQASLDWWHYLVNTWIVMRKETLVDFSNILLSKLHSKDRLLVLPAKGPGLGWLPKEAWEWINKNLKSEW